MTERFIIEGKKRLEGTVSISGAKNAAGPVLAATLLTQKPCIIDNLPLVEDVFKMLKLLETIGVEVEWQGERKIKVTAGEKVSPEKLDASLISATRLSVLLIGPLLSRFKEFTFMPPGGDRIIGGARVKGGGRVGIRPITTHLEALGELGARYERTGNTYHFKAKKFRPREVVLKEFSVTATENLMMLAAGIPGKTIIKSAAAEPHVQALGKMLKEMGAGLEGIGTHTIEIEGKEKLKGVHHKIIPDYLEAGTFAVAGALTPGRLKIKNFPFNHLDLFLAKLQEMEVRFIKQGEMMVVDFSPEIKSVRVQALPYPGFPTDLLPIITSLLTQAKGRSLVHDPLYENRLNFLHELRKMGADIEIVDPHRAFVFGKTSLSGIKISSWDIRAGASLLTAALAADGQTTIENIYQIDRGYEKIDEKLRKVGADIKRCAFENQK